MTIERYEEADRLRRVNELSPRGRVAFALLCATRLVPQYRRFHEKTGRGDPQRVEELAVMLWQHLTTARMSTDDLEQAVEHCMDLIPTEDDGWDDEVQASAEDAGAALAYAYRAAVTGDAQEAVWASRRAYEAMDHFAGRHETGSEYDEDARLRHPAVQSELSRQVLDIDALRQLDDSNDTQSLEHLRHRAEQEAVSVFSE